MLSKYLVQAGAADAALIPISSCDITKPHLLQKLDFTPKSVCVGIIPYYTHLCDRERSVSAYAVARDYHILVDKIGSNAIEICKSRFPKNNFAYFGDHSPIDERMASAKAGLGIIGRNGLLITPLYSSYVFIMEIFSDIECDNMPKDVAYCEDCGACVAACPGTLSGKGECLSSITQKKGELTELEINLIKKYGCAWGCDICQEVCPHTKKAKSSGTIYTNNEWFTQNVVLTPSEESLENDEDFKSRAYSWRGKPTILRNIKIIKKN